MSISSDTYKNYKIDLGAREREWQVHCRKNLLLYPARRKYIYAKRYFMK